MYFLDLWAGPFLHFFMGMPDEKQILDGKCTPERGTRMYALTTHSLAVVAFMAGSYAIIHFAVFIRKMALPVLVNNITSGNLTALR